MSFQFAPDYIGDHGCGTYKYWFSQDLRQFFPKTDGIYGSIPSGKGRGNNDIGKILKRRGVITTGMDLDTEYSCTYVYFKTKRDAKAFLSRLNALREVKNYVEPPKPPSGPCIVMTVESWKQLKAHLKDNMEPKKHEALQNLELELWEMEL